MPVIPPAVEATRTVWFLLSIGFAELAVWVAVTETWASNGDGPISLYEALLFPVCFVGFPLHALLSLAPKAVLAALGATDACWPSSALVAVALSLPLGSLLLTGGLLAKAWLERAAAARRLRRGGCR